MYAIIKSGSRQYQVQPESIISVNRLRLEQGAEFETDQVLLVDGDGADTQIGVPFVSGALVKGEVIEHYRGSKVLIFKHKRRKNYRRTRGHRQELTRVRIDAIELGGKIVAGAKAPAKRTKAPAAPKDKDEAATDAAAVSETAAKSAAKPAAKAAAKPAPKSAAKAPARSKPAASKAGAGKKPAAKASAGKKPTAKAAASKPKAAAKPAAKRTTKPAAKGAAKPKAPKGTGKK